MTRNDRGGAGGEERPVRARTGASSPGGRPRARSSSDQSSAQSPSQSSAQSPNKSPSKSRPASPSRRSAGPPPAAPRGTLSRSTLWDDDEVPEGPQPLRARWDPVPPPGEPARRKPRPPARPQRRRSGLGWFVHRYGWRAYALPVLTALTVMVVIGLIGSSGTGAAAPEPQGGTSESVTVTVDSSVPTTVTVSGPPVTTTVQRPVTTSPHTGTTVPQVTANDPNGTFSGIAAGALPPGASFAKTGAGTFHVVPGKTVTMGHGPEHRTFTIEVEDGIQNAAKDKLFAEAVVSILSDTRSWIGSGDFTLKRISEGTPDFRVSLASQMTVREPQNCGWQIQLEASCYNRLDKRVFINDARWVRGAVSYNGDLGSYRVYAVNHEVGHALGFHHQPCGEDGGLAPVMMQQSWSTADDDLAKLNPNGSVPADGKVCKYNPFPYPRGGDGAASSGAATGDG